MKPFFRRVPILKSLGITGLVLFSVPSILFLFFIQVFEPSLSFNLVVLKLAVSFCLFYTAFDCVLRFILNFAIHFNHLTQ